MKKSGGDGGMKANISSAKNHAINKNAGDGRVKPKGAEKYMASKGEKTYGFGGGKR